MSHEWISMNIRLPGIGQRVLLGWSGEDGGQRPAAHLMVIKNKLMWVDEWSIEPMKFNDYPTHWMPLPESPAP